jgi:minor extracellular serine protease Vpr
MKRFFSVLLTLLLVLSVTPLARAQSSKPERALPQAIADLKLDTPIESNQIEPRLDARLAQAQGPQDVIVRLSTMAVGELVASSDATLDKSPRGQRQQLKHVKDQQDRMVGVVTALDPKVKVLGTTQRVRNLLLLEMDGTTLPELAANPEVLSVRPVVDYEMDLTHAVPYVGGTAVHAMGYTGLGVRIAILDNGIDYTHALLGGSGIVADYDNNDPTIIEPGTFPTAKVIGGWDFVGAEWPYGPLAPDPDPLDKPTYLGLGHGTFVASVAAGSTGMAPDASLYALKTCSSVSLSCSGIAILQALDWITDSNGDGDTSDHVDIANMSLGSPYGQPFDDDSSKATEIAVQVGVLVVASTGNNGDIPYIGSTPGATMSALAVAATENPSNKLPLIIIVSPASIAGIVPAIWQRWTVPLSNVIEAPVGYFASPDSKRLGCNEDGSSPYAPGEFAGKIALVDRGVCYISQKVQNAEAAGALAVIVGLVAPGDPTWFAFGGGEYPNVPAFNISQADADKIKSQLETDVILRLDPESFESLAGTVSDYSSRGPSTLNYIKPEIAAPGDMVAAAAGGGTTTWWGAGTSYASPMVTGAGALLKQAQPGLNAQQLKAALVENAETNVKTKASNLGGQQAPITRIGGGELRIDRAVLAKGVALEVDTQQPVLSFGLVDADKNETLIKQFKILNLTGKTVTYNLTSTFRFAEDAASGAVAIKVSPSQVKIRAYGQSATITIQMKIDPYKLAGWTMNSGPAGASGDILTANEFDGYVWMDDVSTPADDADMMHMPWHVLPRLSGKVDVGDKHVPPNGTVSVANGGAGPAYIDTYSLLAVSEKLPPSGWGEEMPVIDLKYVGVQTYPVPANFCSDQPSFVFAVQITTWERLTHADYPAEFDVYFDTNRDGEPDFIAYNADLSGYPNIDGRNVTWVYDMQTRQSTAYFFTDHATNSTNMTLYLCGEQIGMNAANFGQMIDGAVYAFDNYFRGTLTDYVEGLTFAPLGERYVAQFGTGDYYSTNLAPNSRTTLTVLDLGAQGTNSNELGVLLVNTAPRGNVMSGAAIEYEATPLIVQP